MVGQEYIYRLVESLRCLCTTWLPEPDALPLDTWVSQGKTFALFCPEFSSWIGVVCPPFRPLKLCEYKNFMSTYLQKLFILFIIYRMYVLVRLVVNHVSINYLFKIWILSQDWYCIYIYIWIKRSWQRQRY